MSDTPQPLFVILGMDPDEWERTMEEGRKTLGWKGMPVSAEPNYHAHPALGIIGHGHSKYEVARTPHIHRPEVGWDWLPIFIEVAAPEDGES
jgi:hypothetical protein